MDLISAPWPWYVAGPLIALVMFLLLIFGKEFGVSSNLRTLCSIGGAGKVSEFFRFSWKDQVWNLVFVGGAVIGGFIASQYLTSSPEVAISSDTKAALTALGFENPGTAYAPAELFGMEVISSWQGVLFLVIGGLLICLLYTSPSPRDGATSRMPSSA